MTRRGWLASLVRSISGSFIVQSSSMLIALVSSVFVARWLGAIEYGYFTFATSWVFLLNNVARVGTADLVVRDLSRYLATGRRDLARGLLRWSRKVVIVASLLVSCVFWVVSHAFKPVVGPAQVDVLWIAALVIPFTALIGLNAGALRGLHRVIAGLVPIQLVAPGGFLLFVAVLRFTDVRLSAVLVMWVYLGTVVAAYLASISLLVRPAQVSVRGVQSRTLQREWFASMVPFVLIAGMGVLNTRLDVLMLGFLRGAHDVGVYSVAARGGAVVLFGLTVVDAVIAPQIAQFHAQGNRQKLQDAVTLGARLSLLISIVIGGALITFGHLFLGVVGSEYQAGYLALVLIVAANLANVAAGPLVNILNMTKRASVAALAYGFGVGLNVVLNLLLVPRWGMVGAATATLASTLAWNGVLVARVWNSLGINPTAFRG